MCWTFRQRWAPPLPCQVKTSPLPVFSRTAPECTTVSTCTPWRALWLTSCAPSRILWKVRLPYSCVCRRGGGGGGEGLGRSDHVRRRGPCSPGQGGDWPRCSQSRVDFPHSSLFSPLLTASYFCHQLHIYVSVQLLILLLLLLDLSGKQSWWGGGHDTHDGAPHLTAQFSLTPPQVWTITQTGRSQTKGFMFSPTYHWTITMVTGNQGKYTKGH